MSIHFSQLSSPKSMMQSTKCIALAVSSQIQVPRGVLDEINVIKSWDWWWSLEEKQNIKEFRPTTFFPATNFPISHEFSFSVFEQQKHPRIQAFVWF